MKLNRKGKARIYTDSKENVTKIKRIIRNMNHYEYTYLPKDLIAVFEGHINHVWNHKFCDLDMDDLIRKCHEKGIWMFYTIDPEYPHVP